MGSRNFRFAGFFVLVLLGSGALSSCTKKEPDDGVAVFRKIMNDDVKSFDPAVAYDEVSLEILPNILETLYQYDIASDTYRVVPLLAADLPGFSKDRLSLRIPIRKGVRYQDDPVFPEGKGRELKAQDFVYAMKRLADPRVESQGAWIFEGKLAGFDAFQKKLRQAPAEKVAEVFEKEEIEGLRALDDSTLELKLVKPYPQILHVLTMTFASPVAPEVVAKYGNEKTQIGERPIGTGPFRFARYDRGHEVVLERNPSFRGDPMPMGTGLDVGKPMPFVDRLVFPIVKELQPSWMKFLNGEAEFTKIPKDSFAQALTPQMKLTPEMEKRKIQLSKISGAVFYFLNFNVRDKTLSNKYLRQAISSAVNREQWIELFTNNRGEKMTTMIPAGIEDRVENSVLKYDYDLARAKALMKKAGYPNGKGLPTLTFDMRGADTMNRQMGEFFTRELAKIGVTLNVVYNTFPAFLEKQNKGQFQFSLGGWILDYPDVENGYQQLYASKTNPIINASFFNHPRYNALYEKMAVMDPGAERAKIVKEMDDLIQEEVPWAFGFYRNDYVLVQPWVRNFRASFFTRDGYKYYGIDRELRKQFRK
jgi:ABC-type transport system substrate-binding protein